MSEKIKQNELSGVSGGAEKYDDGRNTPACDSFVCAWCGGDKENHAGDCPYYARPLTCYHCKSWSGKCSQTDISPETNRPISGKRQFI